jgi:hypothetical protein
MASLKLENRTVLFYNTYKYKAVVKVSNMRVVHNSSNFAEFTELLVSPSHPYQISAIKSMNNTELEEVSKLIEYRNKIKNRHDISIRNNYSNITFYSNKLDILKEIWDFSPRSSIIEVNLMPVGIMTFSREPKHKFRVYMKNRRVSITSLDDFADYVKRTKNVFPSEATLRWINRRNRHYIYSYSNSNHFIDYDDPGILTILHLVCPEVIGKCYKLEKR